MLRFFRKRSSLREIPSSASGTPLSRLVYITGKHKHCSNHISTGKYNLLTFVPKFLFEQFRRYSNIFFLMIALLQQIPNVSPTGRYTTAAPLMFILSVSALKEIFEDVKRHRADRAVNRSEVLVLDKVTSKWVSKYWKNINVGDVVKVKNDSFFPADLLLISSSEPNGMSYIETANLDGETNLKVRKSLAATYKCVTNELVIENLSTASIHCASPNKHLYEFQGNFNSKDRTVYPLTQDQILLRGAKLKNTGWVIGIALYTGHETKIMLNTMRQARMKQSRVEKATDEHLIHLFAVLLTMGLTSTLINRLSNITLNHWYLHNIDDLPIRFELTFFTFFILYTNLIPISLQVILEMVRFIQAHFINSDLKMYCSETDTPAMARTSNLNEELGLVRFLLSDKTGTLTKNQAEFRNLSVAGIILSVCNASKIVHYIKTSHDKGPIIRELLTLLAVCHTVVPDKNIDDKDGTIKYQAASPDEGALVKGVSNIGFKFTTRTPEYVHITALGKEERYQVLNVLEFSSERKRMSVIVKCPNGSIKLYVKGADTVIYERLKERQYADITIEHLTAFASQGLRTLCCAYAVLDEKKYHEWSRNYQRAITDVSQNRTEIVSNAMDEIESNLTLLGATAIEDKLQEGVPEAIDTLLKAGIKIWVLTGDKQETAINVGHSCNLIKSENTVAMINETSLDATREVIREIEANSSLVIVVDGKSLTFALSDNLKGEFMDLALVANAVICCRVSPIQKAEIVELVKNRTDQVCLAIGDGANDVAMIRAANVGVGISGNEGLQAAHSADYSISQFRFLTRLLLVHGSWSLSRLCKLILYSFYKNAAFSVIELWFAIYSAWSGQTIFERWTLSLYNVIFTAFPPLAIGLFDQFYSEKTLLKNPQIYSTASKNIFSLKLFWAWIFEAFWHSLTLFWLTYLLIFRDALWSCGLSDGGFLIFGNFLYTYVVTTVCLKAGIELHTWTRYTHYAIWGSIFLWFFFITTYSFFWPLVPIASEMFGMAVLMFSSLPFWFGLIIIPAITLLPDVTFLALRNTLNPSL